MQLFGCFLSPICHLASPYHKTIGYLGHSDDNIVSQLVSKYMANFWLLFCHLMSPGVVYRDNIGFGFIKLTAYMVSYFIGILLQLFAVFLSPAVTFLFLSGSQLFCCFCYFFVTCCHRFSVTSQYYFYILIFYSIFRHKLCNKIWSNFLLLFLSPAVT